MSTTPPPDPPPTPCPTCGEPEGGDPGCRCNGEGWPVLARYWLVECEVGSGDWANRPGSEWFDRAADAWDFAESEHAADGARRRVVLVERRLWRTMPGGEG